MGRKHVGTLMKRMGIEALYRKPGTSKKHPGHEDLSLPVAGLDHQPGQPGVGAGHDVYPMAKGFVYLTAVIDWASREGVGRKGCDHVGGLPCCRCAARGFSRHGTPEIVNTDQGSQFTAHEFVQAVKEGVQAQHGWARSLEG